MQVCGVFLMPKDSKNFVKKLWLEEMDCSGSVRDSASSSTHSSVNESAALHRAAHTAMCIGEGWSVLVLVPGGDAVVRYWTLMTAMVMSGKVLPSLISANGEF